MRYYSAERYEWKSSSVLSYVCRLKRQGTYICMWTTAGIAKQLLKSVFMQIQFYDLRLPLEFWFEKSGEVHTLEALNHTERHDIKPWDNSLSCSEHNYIDLVWYFKILDMFQLLSLHDFMKKVWKVSQKTRQIFFLNNQPFLLAAHFTRKDFSPLTE